MYPLRFKPVFQRYLWGGHRLATVLNKPIGDQPAAESWELVDHRDGQSVVANGPLSGKTLHQLVVEYDIDLVGEKVWKSISALHLPTDLQLRFPLLFKFLDANRDLSIQVHPDDHLARTLDPPDLGKTEAWYVLAAEPGAKIYIGLQEGVDEQTFRAAVKSGTTGDLMHCIYPTSGDCIFVQAGTVHALGAGLLVVEIQQASNATFRVFDWNRVDRDGRPRPLHVEQAIAAIDYQRGPVEPHAPERVSEICELVIECRSFEMHRWQLRKDTTVGGDGRFYILAVTNGAVTVEGDLSDQPLGFGQTMLVPACWGPIKLHPIGDAELLTITC